MIKRYSFYLFFLFCIVCYDTQLIVAMENEERTENKQDNKIENIDDLKKKPIVKFSIPQGNKETLELNLSYEQINKVQPIAYKYYHINECGDGLKEAQKKFKKNESIKKDEQGCYYVEVEVEEGDFELQNKKIYKKDCFLFLSDEEAKQVLKELNVPDNAPIMKNPTLECFWQKFQHAINNVFSTCKSSSDFYSTNENPLSFNKFAKAYNLSIPNQRINVIEDKQQEYNEAEAIKQREYNNKIQDIRQQEFNKKIQVIKDDIKTFIEKITILIQKIPWLWECMIDDLGPIWQTIGLISCIVIILCFCIFGIVMTITNLAIAIHLIIYFACKYHWLEKMSTNTIFTWLLTSCGINVQQVTNFCLSFETKIRNTKWYAYFCTHRWACITELSTCFALPFATLMSFSVGVVATFIAYSCAAGLRRDFKKHDDFDGLITDDESLEDYYKKIDQKQ